VLLDGPGQLIRAKTYTGWHPFYTPLYLVRRRADTFTAITVIEAGEKAPPIAKVERLAVTMDGRELPPADALALRIAMKDGRIHEIIDRESALGDARLTVRAP
jgi:hypothetical protein